MSISTLMNALPVGLRAELKDRHLMVTDFTTEARTTVKPGHSMLVPQGVERMIEHRQELLLIGFKTEQTVEAQVGLLRDIEVLRYTLMLMKREG